MRVLLAAAVAVYPSTDVRLIPEPMGAT
ncbi:MAG: hypothetical protein RL153_240, partial [Verrucomicrobiota bacterium]